MKELENISGCGGLTKKQGKGPGSRQATGNMGQEPKGGQRCHRSNRRCASLNMTAWGDYAEFHPCSELRALQGRGTRAFSMSPTQAKRGLEWATVGVEQATVGLIGGFDLWDLGEGLGVEVDGFWGRAKTQPGEAALGSGCARAIQIVRRRA